jgi:hypothetical protein
MEILAVERDITSPARIIQERLGSIYVYKHYSDVVNSGLT